MGRGDWDSPLPNTTQYIATDLTYPTQIIPLQGKPCFDVGDWVVLTHDTTQEWVDEHNMSDLWGPNAIQGSTFYRQVIAVDDETNTITIDAPIRYYLLPRDRARVYKGGASCGRGRTGQFLYRHGRASRRRVGRRRLCSPWHWRLGRA